MKAFFQYPVLICLAIALVIVSCGPQPQSKQSLAASNQEPQPAEYYTCPMHPSVRSDKPGACPICHMTLVRVSATQVHRDSSRSQDSVELSAAEQIRANISTTSVHSASLVKEISAAGKIDVAETSTRQITARFGGRIERLFVSFVGQTVKSGEPVAEIYSPDAITAQREFLVALNSPSINQDGSDLLKQSRVKLRLWGFTDQQIDKLAKDQTPETSVTIYSPLEGTVLKKNVDLQKYVSAGESLFDISDLRTVWLQLDVYETDVASLHLGQTVEASMEGIPVHTFSGKVSFISPTMDPTTRTVRVRAILENPTARLKPEMYAHATILVPLSKSLVIPATAVISNGKTDVVWIERERGVFEPRQVVLGERTDRFYQVLGGLLEGESVAVSGAYLIDSESQLRQTNTSR